MSKHLRLSEKWFNRGLWLVSILFAWFLIGLGSTIINDLPKVEKPLMVEDFYDETVMPELREKEILYDQEFGKLRSSRERLEIEKAQISARYQAEKENHLNYLATKGITDTAKEDPELLAKAKVLETLRIENEKAEQALLTVSEETRQLNEKREALQGELYEAREAGFKLYQKARDQMDLRVFIYRLLLTLPLLLIAGYLFKTKRHSSYWPFVWGFIFFALFAFFVELVPYLPSYGGYVRYGVGVILTFFGGHYVINALRNYLKRQKEAEAAPEPTRRQELQYEMVFARLEKGVCPGCERRLNLASNLGDYCPHCGLHLFAECGACGARKSTFAHFCHQCGIGDHQEKVG